MAEVIGVVATKIESTKVTITGYPYTLKQLREVVKAFDGMEDDTDLVIFRVAGGVIGQLDFIAPPHPSIK